MRMVEQVTRHDAGRRWLKRVARRYFRRDGKRRLDSALTRYRFRGYTR